MKYQDIMKQIGREWKEINEGMREKIDVTYTQALQLYQIELTKRKQTYSG